MEAAGIAVFVSMAAASLWFASPALPAAGYLAHGVWDVAHHPRAITTAVAGWYPPFCLVYDVLGGVVHLTPSAGDDRTATPSWAC